jgi:hypothetical protein
LYWTRGDWPRIHLIETLLRELASEHAPNAELAGDARSLDKCYTTTRYPGVLDHALPAASFVRREADSALVERRSGERAGDVLEQHRLVRPGGGRLAVRRGRRRTCR